MNRISFMRKIHLYLGFDKEKLSYIAEFKH